MRGYITESGSEGLPLIRENVEKLSIIYFPGLSTAYPKDPKRPREREAFLRDVLNPMIERGEVGDGIRSKWDDRKFRLHSASLTKRSLELQLGITHYQECADCRKLDSKKIGRLRLKGERIFGDSSAFFTKGCGIEATVITGDGSIFVGRRKVAEKSGGYPGELAAVNGWANYKERLENVNFEEDVMREVKEEYGIRDDDINKLIFSGVFSSSARSDTDFAFLVPLNITDGKFLERFKERKDKEHHKLVKIASYQNLQRLLQTDKLPEYSGKFNILFSLRASLEQIRYGEMAN